MFYAHFVLSKKGPLARIWLAAHWDKKLTKAHVFETNIDSSVEAILQPKVKMALRTSGHLLLGVVRIYSRKAKYLLADCNEAFVKIKMAFRPGVVDLPEENREAAVAAITLQENFHDFETTLADLEDIDVQAQFSVNQSRPEEITMREDLGSITLMGDDGFGDVGFDEREILRDTSHLEDPLFKNPDVSSHHGEEKDKHLDDPNSLEKAMEVDIDAAVTDDGFGGAVGESFMGHEFMESAGVGLFEDTPMPDVPMAQEVGEESSAAGKPEEGKAAQPSEGEAEAAEPTQPASGASGEQTTLVHNEQEAFALEPLEITAVTGTEKKGKRKRKLIVDEQKGIPSETMKLQLADTSDIVTTLDLAPPTKKLMHWKETGGVDKLFALPGRTIVSKLTSKLFTRNLVTKPMKDEDDADGLLLDYPEIAREEDSRLANTTRQSEMSTIVEEPSLVSEVSTRTRRSERRERERKSEQVSLPPPPPPPPAPVQTHPEEPILAAPETTLAETSTAGDIFAQTFNETLVDLPNVTDHVMDPNLDPNLEDGPPSIAPFSVPPPSVAPPSVAPPSVAPPAFEDLEADNEQMPETEEQEEKRWSKRTQQMQHIFDLAFRCTDTLSFNDMARKLNRKQAASRFYTLLVLKKHQAVDVEQSEPYGDILIRKGVQFGVAC